MEAPFNEDPSLLKKKRFAGMWGMKLLRSPWTNGTRVTPKLFI
jgi:hypothetical protein